MGMHTQNYLRFKTKFTEISPPILAPELAPIVRRLAKDWYGHIDNDPEGELSKFFAEVMRCTGEWRKKSDSPTTYTDLVDNWSGGKSSALAFATYYFLHTTELGCDEAEKIDIQLLGGLTYNEAFGTPVPGGYKQGELRDTHSELMRAFDEQAFELLEGYEPHDIEDDFAELLARENDKSGYWFLSAGPGMGKSAILASLKRRYESADDCFCIYYAFRFGRADAQLHEHYRYALARLSGHYGEPLEIPESGQARRDLFFKTVEQLQRKGSISAQRKLILIVDALDEMDESTQIGQDRDNPLGWPSVLPEGVFVACSKRLNPTEQSRKSPFSRNMRKVLLDAGDLDSTVSEMHRNTVERYVTRACKKNQFILEYHRYAAHDAGTQAKSDFVQKVCKETNYNFMIVRGLLNDRDYWSSESSHRPLPQDLDTYYEDLFERLTVGENAGVNKYLILCLALRSKFSNFVFLLLLGGGVGGGGNTTHRDVAKATLEQWVNQGLVLRERRAEHHWYGVYHSTFREFLQAKLEAEDRYDFADQFALNLANGQFLDGGLRFIQTQKVEIIEDWVSLTLALLIRLENVYRLDDLMKEKSFWEACSKTPAGLSVAIEAMNRVQPTPDNIPEFEEFFHHAAERLVNWVGQGEIEPRRGLKRSLSDLYEMALASDYTMAQGSNTLRFPHYIFSTPFSFEAGGDPSANHLDAVTHLLGTMKAHAREGNFEKAFDCSRQTERVLDPNGDKAQWSQLFYQRGMLHHTLGEYEESVEQLRLSRNTAFEGGAMVSGFFSDYRYELGRYLLGDIDGYAAYDSLAARYFDTKMEIEKNGPSGLASNLLYNVSVSLSHLAFEVRPHKFDFWMESFLGHAISLGSAEKLNAIYEFYRYQAYARKSLLDGDVLRAIRIFSLYLQFGFPLPTVSGPPLIPDDRVHLVQGIADDMLEIGRDYRDLARAIMACPELGEARLDFATQVWSRGLAMPDVRGNRRFLLEMKEDQLTYK